MEELIGLAYLKKNEIKDKTCDDSRPFAFISYSHDSHDSQIVRNVFMNLNAKGYNLWIDTANMPHDENAWTVSALKALLSKNCKFAFFFRSESSMIKETIAKELEKIKNLEHIGSIVTVDIWQKKGNTAEECAKDILNSCVFEHIATCDKICSIVSTANSAIRLAADAQNDVRRLVEAMEEELKLRGVMPQIADPPGPPDPPEPPDQPDPPEPPEPPGPEKRISLPDFFKKYKTGTFNKNTFQTVRLVGEGEYTKYTTGVYDSVYDVTWDFVMKLLAERGEDYIRFVNEQNSDSKNPVFITAEEHQKRKEAKSNINYRQISVPGLENYSMNRNYAPFAWVQNVLRKRMEELKMPLSVFTFEYTEDKKTGGITGTVKLNGQPEKETRKPGGKYNLTLYGTFYENLNLKQTLLMVFHQALDRHPDKLDLLLDKLPCLGENQPISPDAKPATFRQGETHDVNGRTISIGTSLGAPSVMSYIQRLMTLCEEPEDSCKVDCIDADNL